jgi:hypothetical protein
MGLMAGFAGKSAGVLVGFDLWEPLGFGSGGGMALDAKRSGVELGGDDGRIVGVLGEWAVACFAIDSSVLASVFGGDDVGVADFAGLMPGVFDGEFGDFLEGSATVVTVLPETAWNDNGAHHKDGGDANNEEGSKPKEMSGVLEYRHKKSSAERTV